MPIVIVVRRQPVGSAKNLLHVSKIYVIWDNLQQHHTVLLWNSSNLGQTDLGNKEDFRMRK